MTLKKLSAVKDEDTRNKDNTYIVPITGNNLGFIRDELCYVREVTKNFFVFFRALDGKIYKLTEDKLVNFKLIEKR